MGKLLAVVDQERQRDRAGLAYRAVQNLADVRTLQFLAKVLDCACPLGLLGCERR